MTAEQELQHPAEECELQAQAVAWLQGELEAGERTMFEDHLRGCGDCTELVRDARKILASWVPHRAAPNRRMGRPLLAAAAALLLLASGLVLGGFWGSPAALPASADDSQVSALGWIEGRLSADGSFDPASWPALGAGQQVGVHAFAVLALARGSAEAASPARSAHVSRAAHWLLARQDVDGRLGQAWSAGRFDHAVATLALLEAWHLTGEEQLRRAADLAVGYALHTQAWAAGAGPAGEVGVWTLAALLRARELGWQELPLDAAIARVGVASRTMTDPLIGADLLSERSFWSAALGPVRRWPEAAAASDLYSASARVLAAR